MDGNRGQHRSQQGAGCEGRIVHRRRHCQRGEDANVLVMSLRLTSPTVAKEILEAWFASEPEESEAVNIEMVAAIESKYSK